jgi:uncharacterized membrane protein
LSLNKLLFTAFLTLLPIAELRGGLPFALANGMHPLLAYGYCVLLNILVAPLVLLFLSTMHKLLYKWKTYAKIFNRLIERSRKKVKAKVDKYGYLGLTIFVAIPLPITGAYTGALGAWVLGMDKKKSFLAISIGVCIAGIIVYIAYLIGFTLFFKKVI